MNTKIIADKLQNENKRLHDKYIDYDLKKYPNAPERICEEI